MKFWRIVSAAIVLAAASSTAMAAEAWMGAWTAAPLRRNGTLTPLNNQTVRSFAIVAAGGDQVRVRISNEYGSRPLIIDAATVALANPDGSIVESSVRPLTFGGKPSIYAPQGAPVYSDPTPMKVAPSTRLAVSIHLPLETLPETYSHAYTWNVQVPPLDKAPAQISSAGDYTRAATLPGAVASQHLFISGIDVLSRTPSGVVAVLSSSRTVGQGVWPELLARRLSTARGVKARSVVNAAAIALPMVRPARGGTVGVGLAETGASRFNRDVLMVPGLTHVIIDDFVNDLGQIPPPELPATLETLQAGYLQLVARAHARGVKVIATTTMPYTGFQFMFGDVPFHSPEKERLRVALNQWVRTSGVFDGVIDLDAVMRDPADPSRLKPGMHLPDNLTPNEAGDKLIADSIDLKLFR